MLTLLPTPGHPNMPQLPFLSSPFWLITTSCLSVDFTLLISVLCG